MIEIGLSYFVGYNVTDLLFIVTFDVYAYYKFSDIDVQNSYFPELKLLIVILSFVKLLSYIRIFEQFGFLVQMIIFCV